MKKFFFVLGFILFSTTTAYAQVYKCKNAQGKMEYSDIPCAGVDSQKVNIVVPSLGTPIASKSSPLPTAGASNSNADSSDCKFSYFAMSDSKGKALAKNAKEECIENKTRRANGQPTSLEAYNLWKDHHEMSSNNRNAAISRAQKQYEAQRAAQQSAEESRVLNEKLDRIDRKEYKCRQTSRDGEYNCR